MDSPIEHKKLADRHRVLDSLNVAVAMVDSGFQVLHFNPAYRKLFQSVENRRDILDFGVLFEDFSEKLHALQHAGLHSGHLQNFIVSSLRQSDTERFFDLQVSHLDADVELIEGFAVVVTEVTDREKELVHLREISDHHQKFIEFTTSGVLIHRNGKIVHVNEQGRRMVRAAEEDSMIGRNVLDFIAPEYKEIAIQRIQDMVEHNTPAEPLEELIIREDQSTFTAEIFAYPIVYQGLPAIKVVMTDISLRKQAEENLIKSEKRYHELIDNLLEVVFQTDKDANLTFLNEAWQTLSGFSSAESLGKSVLNFITDATGGDNIYSRIRRLLLVGVSTHEEDLILQTKDGNSKYIQVKFHPIYDEANIIQGISGLIIDIDDRKRAQIELENKGNILRRHQKIYLDLAKIQVLSEEGFRRLLHEIARTSAESMALDRVNIWKFNDDGNTLTCLVNYDNRTKNFSDEGLVLHNFKHYIDIIQQERIVNVSDTLNDPRVVDFLDNYIIPDGILSMMDAGILIGENTWGVICFDMISKKKNWSVEDQSFASNLADMISISVESKEKSHTLDALHDSRVLNSTILDNASDAIILISDELIIEEANQTAYKVSGYDREELAGAHVSLYIPKRFLTQGEMPMIHIAEGQTVTKNRLILCKDGTEKMMEISASRLPGGKILAILRDVTERNRKEQALKDSETRLDLALKGADLGTWDFYIKENKIIHNRRWAEMLGYHFEITTVNEQFWEKFVHPADIDTAYSAFQDHMNGLTPSYEANLRMLASSGEWRWIHDKGKVVEWDENGEPVRASGIHQDVTALRNYERELEEQRMFLNQIINAIPYPLYVRNAKDEFIIINNAFADFLGIENKGLIQYKFNRKLTPDENKKGLFDKDMDILLTKQSIHIDEHLLVNSSTGEEHWLHTIKVPLLDQDGVSKEVLSVSMEITDIKKREMRLMETSAELEERLSERSNMLENLNKEVETFNYSVSHDLRTPLRTIDIFAYFLEKKYAEKLDKEGKENLMQIRKSITKMSTLIDNLMIYIRMGKSVMMKQEVNVADMVQGVILDLTRIMDLSNVRFELGDLPVMYADKVMLRQAVSNLLNNAVKFSSTKETSIIEVHGFKEGHSIVLSVKDNGVGFSMEYKDKLFTAFKRLHSEDQFDGTGVGLAIVEKVVHRMGGEIWAESIPNQYTSFFVKLPLQ